MQEVCEHCTQSSELLGPNRQITYHRNSINRRGGANQEHPANPWRGGANQEDPGNPWRGGANQEEPGNPMELDYCPVHSPRILGNNNSENLYSSISVKQDKHVKLEGSLLKPGVPEIYATIQPRIKSSSPQDPDLVPCKAGSFIMDTFLHSPTTTGNLQSPSGNLQSPPTTAGKVQENNSSAAAGVEGNHKHNVFDEAPDHVSLENVS